MANVGHFYGIHGDEPTISGFLQASAGGESFFVEAHAAIIVFSMIANSSSFLFPPCPIRVPFRFPARLSLRGLLSSKR